MNESAGAVLRQWPEKATVRRGPPEWGCVQMREICEYAGEKRALWAQDTMCIRGQKVGAGPACERGNKEPGVIGAR